MKKIISSLLIIIIGAGLVWFSFYLSKQKNTNGQTPINTNTPQENPIKITSPQANTEITSPVTITGQARGPWFFEASFPIAIIDDKDIELGRGLAQAQGEWMTEDWVSFSATLSFNPTTSTSGFIVFKKDNPSGLPQNDASFKLPIKFASVETSTVQVFFSNNQLDPEMLDCQKVYAINRLIAKTESIGTATINQLLQGPTETEKNQGYFSSINPGVTLQSLKIDKGIAYADFDPKLDEAMGGSCRVTNIRSQIAQTLKQFPSITDVVISINGESETILQP